MGFKKLHDGDVGSDIFIKTHGCTWLQLGDLECFLALELPCEILLDLYELLFT